MCARLNTQMLKDITADTEQPSQVHRQVYKQASVHSCR